VCVSTHLASTGLLPFVHDGREDREQTIPRGIHCPPWRGSGGAGLAKPADGVAARRGHAKRAEFATPILRHLNVEKPKIPQRRHPARLELVVAFDIRDYPDRTGRMVGEERRELNIASTRGVSRSDAS
jgi:hypothetical protein